MNEQSMDDKITRINELYHKSQSEGLTPSEREEQLTLRKEYIANIRANLRGQLNQINIQETDGSITNLGKKFGQEQANGNTDLET